MLSQAEMHQSGVCIFCVINSEHHSLIWGGNPHLSAPTCFCGTCNTPRCSSWLHHWGQTASSWLHTALRSSSHSLKAQLKSQSNASKRTSEIQKRNTSLLKAASWVLLTLVVGELQVVVHGGHKLLNNITADNRCQVALTPGLPLQHFHVVV